MEGEAEEDAWPSRRVDGRMKDQSTIRNVKTMKKNMYDISFLWSSGRRLNMNVVPHV